MDGRSRVGWLAWVAALGMVGPPSPADARAVRDRGERERPAAREDGRDEGPRLERFRDCRAMEAAFRGAALREPSWRGGPGPLVLRGGPATGMAAEAAADGAASGGARASETNVQEEGVDEPDVVENDGEILYVLSGNDLVLVRAWPPEGMEEVARVDLPGDPIGLYVRGEEAVVLSRVAEPPDAGVRGHDGRGSEPSRQGVALDLYTLRGEDEPRFQRRIAIGGDFVDSRLVGDTLVLVSRWQVSPPALDPEITRDLSRLDPEIQHRFRVMMSSFVDWMPSLSLEDEDGRVEAGPAVECDAVWRDVNLPETAPAPPLTLIVAVDLGDPGAEPLAQGIWAQVDTVYASNESLVLAGAAPMKAVPVPLARPGRRGRPDAPELRIAPAASPATDLHVFEVADLDPDLGPAYVASGRVPGRLVDSFSLGEWEGDLRVATTDLNTRGGKLTSRVTVLRPSRDRLRTLGAIQDIAPGEALYAVRFMGPRGYVVTFERVDPLFALDLSDPRDPRVGGELKVTGYSTYLHPVGDDHLLAVGMEVDPATNRTEGMQISLFDVSDIDRPELVDRTMIEAGEGMSEALYEHHAFAYWAPEGVLAVPVISHGIDGEAFNGLYVYDVDVRRGLSLAGKLDAGGILAAGKKGRARAARASSVDTRIRRTVFIEDVLYAIAEQGIVAADVEDPDEAIESVILRQR